MKDVLTRVNRCLAVLITASVSHHVFASVNTITTFDEFNFNDSLDPYGSFESQVAGPDYGTGYGVLDSKLSTSNPTGFGTRNPSWTYNFQGDLYAVAQSSEGINKALARIDSRETVVDGDRLVGVYGISSWQEKITVTGGTGSGVLKLSARLDGHVKVWGPTNIQGLSGRGLASINYLTSTTPMAPDIDPFQSGLSFACADTDLYCDYDRTLFTSVGALVIESDSSTHVDQIIDLTIPFQYDKPFYLTGTLEVAAYGFEVGAGAESDFFNTGRIVAVSAPVGSTVHLASGSYAAFNLPSPVPEPQTWLLALAGLGMVTKAKQLNRKKLVT
ncbi:MAG: PEP-CTERM sorting domain-containing protein [Aquabacterium sp.]